MEGEYPLSGGDPNALAHQFGFLAWSQDPVNCSVDQTQANVHLVGVFLEAGTLVTGVAVPVGAAGVAVTFAKVGLYDANLNLLAQSADNLVAFQAVGWVKTPFTAPFTVPVSGLYYLASGFVATTTLPSVLNVQQFSGLSHSYPGAQRGVHAQVPVVGQGLPTPAVSQGNFTNFPCLAAF